VTASGRRPPSRSRFLIQIERGLNRPVTGTRLASTAGTMRCGSQPHRRELCSGAVKSTAPFPE
jgi:hypothetical protein